VRGIMIIYKCKCGDELTVRDNSEISRENKRAWKQKHGTRKGNYLTVIDLGNRGHGYTRQIGRKHD